MFLCLFCPSLTEVPYSSHPFCLPVIDLLEFVVQRSRGFLSVKEKHQIAENMLEDLPNELLENVAEWVPICAYGTTELYYL